MNTEIFMVAGDQLTLKTYVPVASQMMSLIAEAAEGIGEISEPLSMIDLSEMLNKVCTHMPGAFEIRRTPSSYCQIVYEPYVLNAAEFKDGYALRNFVDTPDTEQNCLWVSEKVLIAFIDRKLYGVAFMLYFYLGYLMTQDAAFGISHNISFEKILESCEEFPEGCSVKYRTTLMRALADLQDVGLLKWKMEDRTFELFHITSYDPIQEV